ncbi:DUF3365 domain-containing protein [Cyanobium gracile]|uniref:DUF3365 domain-containing protein n=1 Tax=Cyanobium gracile UHCC 0281 TaxID=3110309 RepID=A0ABU5STJ5_9CYAN|nr:DUF3365 domain-containing protein [Cyanobium gracile]MEA5441793.1 DUF3365 domain-containing protein [Cyanobium gracile UHCC 0281]
MDHLLLPLRRLVLTALASLAMLLLSALLLTHAPPAALAAATQAPPAQSPVEPAVLAKAVVEMEQLDRMRIALASTLEGRSEEPTMDTMKEVCKPVGMKAAAIGEANGWQVRQVAAKYRNPDHAPANSQEREVIDLFHRQPAITGLWQPASAEQGAGVNYYRRINVEPSCLACHGTKASRPAFVKDNYPGDKAFDFKVGDLRGMYAVFIPEVPQARGTLQQTSG